MDLLTIALVCGPWVAPATTLRVIQVESAGRPYAIHDNTDNRSYRPQALTDAERIASALIRAGHRVDLGLMQINYEVWLRPAGVTLKQVFEPCTNVGLGTTILSAAYAREIHRAPHKSDALWRSLSMYNSGDPNRGRDYAATVLRSRIPMALLWSQNTHRENQR